MQFPFPFLDELIIPTDAGPGDPRVVLGHDSNGGFIEVYDTGGVLVGKWNGIQFIIKGATNGSSVILVPGAGTNPTVVYLDPPNSPGIGNYNPAQIFADYFNTDETPYVAISGAGIPGEAAPRIDLYGNNPAATSTTPRIVLAPNAGDDGNGGYVDIPQDTSNTSDLRLGNISLGRGVITGKAFLSTVNDPGSPYSGDSNTDFAITNIPTIAGRTIEFKINTRYSINAAGVWVLELMVNGSKVDEIGWINATAAKDDRISASGFWTPSATQATDDIVVFANELSGTSSLTFVGSGNTPRRLIPVDIGVL